ncbi:squalene synthase-like [Sinocyclocheilus rhinocerous]|uniref:squalene synthase-like n=1 Tax=Sinocyclocheilus rhinocerous TaxID=307959 RepID=UPI0007B9E701|nr:PREDICTED: squalene synthase-like [Sinocyclocheilus rhinocerous]
MPELCISPSSVLQPFTPVILISPQILQKVSVTDPSREKTLFILSVIREKSLSSAVLSSRAHHISPVYVSAVMLLAALSWQYLNATAGQPPGGADMQGH